MHLYFLSYKSIKIICFPHHGIDISYKFRLRNVEMTLVHKNANDSSRKEFSGKRSKNISDTRQILTAARRATTPANIGGDTPRVRNSITCTTRTSLGSRQGPLICNVNFTKRIIIDIMKGRYQKITSITSTPITVSDNLSD